MTRNIRFYLDCPYEDREECKELGGRWDPDKRKWYVPSGTDTTGFKKWWTSETPGDQPSWSPDPHRITHCWACHKEVDSETGDKCEKCGWLACSVCGECGCGYEMG